MIPFVVLILVILGFSPGWGAQDFPDRQPLDRLTLNSFKIKGNSLVSTREIKKELSEKLPSFWPPWKKKPIFRLSDLEYDIDRLKIFYRNLGFYHTRITPEIQYETGGKAEVTLIIAEGPWVKVTDLHIEIGGNIDLSELKAKLPIEVGDRFTQKAYNDLKNLYLNYLPDHGYPRAKVQGEVLLDEEKNTANIKLHVDPGPLSFFGKARIKDPDKLETPPAAILEKLTFEPGETFNLSKVFESQRKIYATDLFKSVVVKPEEVPEEEKNIPISIELAEKKKRSLKIGLGYGDEEQIRARLGLRYRNLGGGGRVLDLDARYSYLGFSAEEMFTNPVIFNTKFDLIQLGGVRRRDLPGFSDRGVYSQFRLERDLIGDFRVYGGYGLEFVRPFNIPQPTLISFPSTIPDKTYRASFLMLGLRQDTVDKHLDPHRGGLLNLSLESAPTFLGSGWQFVQGVLDGRRYHEIGDSGLVLAGRVKAGLIQPIQSTTQIPIYRRFFSGGANSVRGYKLDLLGPRNFGGNPIGGNAVIEAGIEFRFPIPIYKNIGGVVFLDAGNVFYKIPDINLGHLKYSPGFGLRYLSPIGAVGIDIAFPTNRIDYRNDAPYQVHFTVGYGF